MSLDNLWNIYGNRIKPEGGGGGGGYYGGNGIDNGGSGGNSGDSTFNPDTSQLPNAQQAMRWTIRDWAEFYGRDVKGFDVDVFMEKFGGNFSEYDPTQELVAREGLRSDRTKFGIQANQSIRGDQNKIGGKGLLLSGQGKQKIRNLREAYSESMKQSLTRQDLGIFAGQEDYMSQIMNMFESLRDKGAFKEETYPSKPAIISDSMWDQMNDWYDNQFG